MSEPNGKYIDLDVTAMLTPIHIKAGDYEFDLPPDIPTTLITRLAKAREAALSDAGPTLEGAVDVIDALYEAFDKLMAAADPQPPRPVRELFTQPAILSIVYFLLSEWGEKAKNTSMILSPSPTTSEGPLPSDNSAEATSSLVPASEY